MSAETQAQEDGRGGQKDEGWTRNYLLPIIFLSAHFSVSRLFLLLVTPNGVLPARPRRNNLRNFQM
jgi:hypothetical protein